MNFHRALVCAAALLASACTPGGVTGSGSSNTPTSPQVTKIDVNLTLNQGGYAPSPARVAVGSFVQFVNSDGFAHTATGIRGATGFPASSPFSVSAQQQSGSTISGSWSSGTLQASQSSQPISVDAAGTYYYGCFFHYGAPMRGTIVAQ
ncbi:MAG TPA: plastocyanin/azurin family copper-binding protein [Candidatus Baltobacteraceae bacterium]